MLFLPLAGLHGFTYPLPQENAKGDSWPCRLLTTMVFSDKKIIIVLPSIISQPCFPFAFSLSFCSPSLPCSLLSSACSSLFVFCVWLLVCACVCMYCQYPMSSPNLQTLDYAEQLRIMQKTKEKLEIALEKHQDCTYLYSPPK